MFTAETLSRPVDQSPSTSGKRQSADNYPEGISEILEQLGSKTKAELASELGLTLNSFTSYLSRARKSLQKNGQDILRTQQVIDGKKVYVYQVISKTEADSPRKRQPRRTPERTPEERRDFDVNEHSGEQQKAQFARIRIAKYAFLELNNRLAHQTNPQARKELQRKISDLAKLSTVKFADTPEEPDSTLIALSLQSLEEAIIDAQKALNELVTHNQPLVLNVVKKTGAIRMPHEEKINAGLIGLTQAAVKYDDSRFNIPFAGFAHARIKGSILDEARRTDPLTRSARSHINAITTAQNELASKGLEPSVEAVSKITGIPVRTIASVFQAISIISLDAAAFPDDNEENRTTPIRNFSLGPTPEDIILEKDERHTLLTGVKRGINLLPARYSTVLRLYYVNGLPMSEIAKELNVSAARISQIHQKAIERLRASLQPHTP